MKPNKKLTWIIGLIVAILSAVMAYFNTSCNTFRTTSIQVDSTQVGHFKLDTQSNFELKK